MNSTSSWAGLAMFAVIVQAHVTMAAPIEPPERGTAIEALERMAGGNGVERGPAPNVGESISVAPKEIILPPSEANKGITTRLKASDIDRLLKLARYVQLNVPERQMIIWEGKAYNEFSLIGVLLADNSFALHAVRITWRYNTDYYRGRAWMGTSTKGTEMTILVNGTIAGVSVVGGTVAGDSSGLGVTKSSIPITSEKAQSFINFGPRRWIQIADGLPS